MFLLKHINLDLDYPLLTCLLAGVVSKRENPVIKIKVRKSYV